MPIKLLQTHTLTFTRTTGNPYVGRDGVAVHSNVTTDYDALGSLQPYQKHAHRIALDEGMREENTYIFLSKTKIDGMSESLNLIPDTTTINGEEYKVVKTADWTGYGLSTDHYLAVLYRVSPQ